MTCCPEQTTFQDVAQAVFTGNPDCLNVEEAEGIWTSQPTTEIQSFLYTTDVSRTKYHVQKLKQKNDVRSPTNPEVQTVPLNFEEIRKRLDDLTITREDREILKNHEFNSASESDSDHSLSL